MNTSELMSLQELNRQLREENTSLRAALDAEQKRTAQLLPLAEDVAVLQQLLQLSRHCCLEEQGAQQGVAGDSEERRDLNSLLSALREQATMERAKADALKKSLLAIKAEAQRFNIACVEVHAAILTGKL